MSDTLTADVNISIVITTYNSAAVIGKTLESLLDQTVQDFELIIVDDCSKDNTVKILESYHDPRIRLVRNATNQGISGSRNIGLGLARGRYIAISDHDDISLPTRLEKQAAFLDSHPDYIMVAANAIEQIGTTRKYLPAVTHPLLLHWTLFHGCPLRHSAIFIRREILERHSIRYNAAYTYAEDFHLYHQLAQHGKLGMLEEYLVIYVIHSRNTSHSNCEVLNDMNQNGLLFMREYYRDYLGLTHHDEDVAVLWKLAILNIPTTDIDTLATFGKFLVEACQRFIDIHQPDDMERAMLWSNTRDTWWKVVRMSAEKTGHPHLLQTASKICPPPLSLSRDIVGHGRSYAVALARQIVRGFTTPFCKLSQN